MDWIGSLALASWHREVAAATEKNMVPAILLEEAEPKWSPSRQGSRWEVEEVVKGAVCWRDRVGVSEAAAAARRRAARLVSRFILWLKKGLEDL